MPTINVATKVPVNPVQKKFTSFLRGDNVAFSSEEREQLSPAQQKQLERVMVKRGMQIDWILKDAIEASVDAAAEDAALSAPKTVSKKLTPSSSL
jgi:hypothetical protein